MLLIGPPGSGKTHFVLEALEEAIRQSRTSQVKLIVPTASMAQHLLHTLARRNLVTPTNLIETIVGFVNRWTPELREPSPALADRLLLRALRSVDHEEFRSLIETGGLRSTLQALTSEFGSAGIDEETIQPLLGSPQQRAFGEVFIRYGRLLQEHGFARPGERILRTAKRICEQDLPQTEIYFDGFVNFTAVERRLIEAAAQKAGQTVVTFPELEGGPKAEDVFPGRPVRRLHRRRLQRPPVIVSARTPRHEIEEVARRILEGGRPFRDYGLILRSPANYARLIQSTFERLKIPYRMRLPQALRNHGAIAYLGDLFGVIAKGFPGERTLEVLSRSWSPLGNDPQVERFDFHLRDKLPGEGIGYFQEHGKNFSRVARTIDKLAAEATKTKAERPPREWTDWVRSFPKRWLSLPTIEDGVPIYRVLELRSLASALAQFDAAAAEASAVLEIEGLRSAGFPEYLEALESVFAQTLFRTPDGRRDVVNVLTVFEARQWELPEVFVCGLVEKEFPKRYPQDLLFPDWIRQRFQKKGTLLRTSQDREEEERALFELATSRAKERSVLTYALFDEEARPLLRSFLLSSDPNKDAAAKAVALPEKPSRFTATRSKTLSSRELTDAVISRHERFSPTSLEDFLQCPYLFFARRTMKLESRPKLPERRFDPLLMGSIIHDALRIWSKNRKRPIAKVFEEVFAQTCEQHHIRLNFRTAIIRNSLGEDLERFASDERVQASLKSQEQDFEVQIDFVLENAEEGPPYHIRGRIDRYDVFDGNSALVVDYKYKDKDGIRELVKQHHEGQRLQGQLYLLGLQEARGVQPAGIRFWGLRGGVSSGGWIVPQLVPPEQVDTKEISPNRLKQILDKARSVASEKISEIRNGAIEIRPLDKDYCQNYCDFRDVCRVKL